MKSEMITSDKIPTPTFDFPEPSGWACYLWGSKPGGGGMTYYPAKGQVPNAFVRFMMKVCFACTWVYDGRRSGKAMAEKREKQNEIFK